MQFRQNPAFGMAAPFFFVFTPLFFGESADPHSNSPPCGRREELSARTVFFRRDRVLFVDIKTSRDLVPPPIKGEERGGGRGPLAQGRSAGRGRAVSTAAFAVADRRP